MGGKEYRLTLMLQLFYEVTNLTPAMGSSPDIGSSKKTTLGSCKIACAFYSLQHPFGKLAQLDCA
jgi:hypothetical protein